MVGKQQTTLALVWVLLCLATLLSSGMSEQAEGTLMVGLLLGVAFLKVYLVMRYFMALGSAPAFWHGLFSGWVVATCLLLLTLIFA